MIKKAGTGILLAAAAASPASAHQAAGAAGGFLTGLSHPVSGPDHVVAMIAVGLWGAQLGRPALWLLPVMFPAVMACGSFLGLIGLPLPGVEVGIAASAVVLGFMVMRAARPPLAAVVLVVCVFALFHGHAHGTELPADQSGLHYSIGFVTATGLLHGVGILIGAVDRWAWGPKLLKGLGASVMVAGVWFLRGALW
jgi:urease accessory protein